MVSLKNGCIFFSSGNTFSNVIATQVLLAASSRLFFYTNINKGCCFEYRHPFFIRRKYPVWKKEKYRCSAFFFFLTPFLVLGRPHACMANEILVIFTTFFSAVLSVLAVLRRGNLGRDWHQ